MSYDYEAHAVEAAELLKRVLPEATKESHGASGVPISPLGGAFFDHATVERLRGVHVYRGERGGWFGDLTFRDMPPGITSVIGTPVDMPCSSREEALGQATHLVAVLVATDRVRASGARPGPPRDPVFLMGGTQITIKAAALAEIARLGDPDEGYVSRRLDELMRRHAPDGRLEESSLDGLAPMEKAKFMAVVAMALLLGMGRWPEPDEAAPGAPAMAH